MKFDKYYSAQRIIQKKKLKADISIKAMKSKDSRLSTQITFRNGVAVQITNSQRIELGIKGNRLYFIPSESGYKLFNPNKNTTDTLYIKPCIELNDFDGSYNLEHDNINDLYFIEKESIIKQDISDYINDLPVMEQVIEVCNDMMLKMRDYSINNEFFSHQTVSVANESFFAFSKIIEILKESEEE